MQGSGKTRTLVGVVWELDNVTMTIPKQEITRLD